MADTQNNKLLLTGAQVFDPSTSGFHRRDVRIGAGKILDVGPALAARAGEPVQDCRGKLLLPGLVDFHLHCFRQGQILSVDAEEVAPCAGTTSRISSINGPGKRSGPVRGDHDVRGRGEQRLDELPGVSRARN